LGVEECGEDETEVISLRKFVDLSKDEAAKNT